MLNTSLLQKWIRLTNIKDALTAKLKQIGEEMADIENPILENLATEGIDSVKLNGRTVFAHTTPYASFEDRELATAAIKMAGYDSVVKENFNANTLSALVRELIKEGKGLPKEFEGVIKINSRIQLRSNRS